MLKCISTSNNESNDESECRHPDSENIFLFDCISILPQKKIQENKKVVKINLEGVN